MQKIKDMSRSDYEIMAPVGSWESLTAAIQAGAITNAKLTDILTNADLDRVRQLATPKVDVLMSGAKKQRAESMAKLGYTQAEISSALGVSVTTLKRSLNGE